MLLLYSVYLFYFTFPRFIPPILPLFFSGVLFLAFFLRLRS